MPKLGRVIQGKPGGRSRVWWPEPCVRERKRGEVSEARVSEVGGVGVVGEVGVVGGVGVVPTYTKLPNPFVACNKLPTCLRGAKQVEDVTVVGTCNGLVCLVAGDDEIHFAASIWNPCIRKLVALPKPGLAVYKDIDQVRYGFGYDSCTDDYKVLRCVNHKYIRHSTCQVEIWSLARGSWKSLSSAADHVILPAKFHPGQLFNRSGVVFVNGALHWLQLARKWKVNKMDYLIASFDMASELFGETTVPEALRKKLYSKPEQREWFISKYRESIALVKICNDRDRWIANRVEIWVMAEYGVAASWANLCTVQLQHVWLMPLGFKYCGPIGFRRSGEVVLMEGSDRSILLDPESEQVDYFEIDESNNHLKFMDYFVESLHQTHATFLDQLIQVSTMV
ncbi:hypothetical protein L3X38_044814 [Prunus dulcis]|uniref:F-box associated beta-propeller type 1 domain-containing protein n=1 Tax=Prunus dulcis TaxID=3755 RepID=A0AAD4YP92_PRUDU|nr:hypothetical protein L3X38_044814 [Prunus dulcis]